MKLTPLNGFTLIKPKEQEKKVGNIIIPDTAQTDKVGEGVILACCEGWWDNGIWVESKLKEGDTVLFGKYAGSEMEVDEVNFLVMREKDVIAVIR